MAPLSLYDIGVTPLIRTLNALSAILKKAETHANDKSIPHSELLEARLAPDMAALPFQIQTVSNTAKFISVRIAGAENVPMEDKEETFGELQARITKTIEFLNAVKREDFDGKEDVEVSMRDYRFTGVGYLTTFALPNFYFHATTAYGILRMKGVDIGKLDFMGKQ